MTRRTVLCALVISDLHWTWTSAAPIIDMLQARLLASELSLPTTPISSNVSSLEAISYVDIESFLLGPAPTPSFAPKLPDVTPEDEPYPFSFSTTQDPTSEPSSAPSVVTTTLIEEELTTIILSALPVTTTKFITVTASPSPTTTSSEPSTLPSPGLGAAKALWTAPPDMKDLTPFNVSKISSGGLRNMKIVTALPSEVLATLDSDPDSDNPSVPDFQSTGSIMQIFYPENSINPGQKPQGGTEFYASPIDISTARNVTLQYSVFFPADFDWVLAGKMPGLYGGHVGCSGGNAALDCFSTRLMWRQGGAGELYLYAPKDKQTQGLCSDPTSVCNAAYGLSIGRGSFKWKPGAWTTVKQTVSLNTPGQQDGVFSLDVDGERAIHREDVFYREDLTADKDDDGKHAKTGQGPTKTSTKKHADPTSSTTDGGLLDPLLGGLLGKGHPRGRRLANAELYYPRSTPSQDTVRDDGTHERMGAVLPRATAKPRCPEPKPDATADGNDGEGRDDEGEEGDDNDEEDDDAVGTESVKPTEVKFVGIFFSTFFGGHDEKYATPKDQYVWFKDFALAYNA